MGRPNSPPESNIPEKSRTTQCGVTSCGGVGGSLEPSSPMLRSELLTSHMLINVLAMLLNVVSVIGCVAFVKLVFMPPHNFTFVNALVSMHFFFTSLAGFACQKLHMYSPKSIPRIEYIKIAAAQVGAVVLINLSLYYNSIGMYQVLKFSNIAVICLIEYLWLGQVYSKPIYASLFTLLFGIYLTTVTDLRFSMVGFVCGMLGATSAAFHQIMCKHVQQVYEVSAIQLLQPQAMYAGIFGALCSLVFDNIPELLAHRMTGIELCLILLGCTCAFLLNFSCYIVIGRTSPITFAVAGSLKTTGTLAFGFLVLHQPCTVRNMSGIVLATVSSMWYAHLQMTEPKPAPSVTTKAQVPTSDTANNA